MSEFKVVGEQLVRKDVVKTGTGACVYLPRAWLGRKVAVILEASDEEQTSRQQ